MCVYAPSKPIERGLALFFSSFPCCLLEHTRFFDRKKATAMRYTSTVVRSSRGEEGEKEEEYEGEKGKKKEKRY